MTISVVLKVGDGVVLGADSASTLAGPAGIANVYFNAEKIWNLVKGLPVGVVTYGLGGLGGRSITRLAKDLRADLSPGGKRALDPKGYTVEQAAGHVREYFFTDRYALEMPMRYVDESGKEQVEFPALGFFIAGYSAKATHGEVWQVQVLDDGSCTAPRLLIAPEITAAVWNGQPEALNRLMRGWSTQMAQGLMNAGISSEEVLKFLESLNVPRLFDSAMPLQDAIDLVHFMVETTIGFVRFAPGPPNVHGPIDSAAITVHEGFRWVRRKHYYSPALNAPVPSTTDA